MQAAPSFDVLRSGRSLLLAVLVDGQVHVQALLGERDTALGRRRWIGWCRTTCDRLRAAQPEKIIICGVHVRRGILCGQKIRDRTFAGVFAGGLGVRLQMGEAFAAIRGYVSAQGIEAAYERPIGVDRAAPVAQEYAGPRVRLLEYGTLFIERPTLTTFTRGDASIAGDARELVGIHLNMLVMAAAQAPVAGVAKGLGSCRKIPAGDVGGVQGSSD